MSPPVSEWSDEKILTFINLLSAEPAIWDPRDKQHKMKHKVEGAWARIGETMNIDVEQLKAKKRSLMAAFRTLINKKQSSLRSDSSADEVYQPTWFAFDAMEQFLGPLYYDVQKTKAEDDSVTPTPSADEWSNEMALQLIDLMATEPIIWDPRNKQRKLRNKVNEAWTRLEEAMDLPIEQLKAKKQSLMACFRQLVNKKKASLQSASSADEVYQPTWFAYDAMEQLLGHLYYDVQKTNAEDDSVTPSADEWSNEMALQFIDLWASEPVIWDPKNKQKKLKNELNEAWTRIEDAMNIPIEQLKAKKQSLMACFRQLVNKKKASLQSASSADEVYQPTWFAYEAMERFLGPIYGIHTNGDVDSENENTQDEDTSMSGQKKRRLNLDDPQTNLSDSFQILNNILSHKNHEEDDCDIYAKLLATKLRKYPDDIRQRIMYKIDGLLLENTFPPSASHCTTAYSSSHSSSQSPTKIISGSPACTSPDNDIPRSPITISIPEDSACWQNSDYLPNLTENTAGTSELQNSINIPSQDMHNKKTQGSLETNVLAKKKLKRKTVSVLNTTKKPVKPLAKRQIKSESPISPGKSRLK